MNFGDFATYVLDGFKLTMLETDSMALRPVIHRRGRVNGEHAHETACVLLMLGGDYRETAALRSFRYERFTAVYHPAGLEHRDEIGARGVRLLAFEFRPELIDARRASGLRDVSGSRVAWDILALYRDAPAIDAVEFESRALELVAGIAPRAHKTPRDLPSLKRARDYIHANFRHRVTVTDVARAAAVHPVYLGQMFHEQFGETLGDYIKRVRVRAAAELLSSSNVPLADVAFEHGFCDQSHFHRVFKRFSGVTPAEFRRAFS